MKYLFQVHLALLALSQVDEGNLFCLVAVVVVVGIGVHVMKAAAKKVSTSTEEEKVVATEAAKMVATAAAARYVYDRRWMPLLVEKFCAYRNLGEDGRPLREDFGGV